MILVDTRKLRGLGAEGDDGRSVGDRELGSGDQRIFGTGRIVMKNGDVSISITIAWQQCDSCSMSRS